jgi:hypothetical protein
MTFHYQRVLFLSLNRGYHGSIFLDWYLHVPGSGHGLLSYAHYINNHGENPLHYLAAIDLSLCLFDSNPTFSRPKGFTVLSDCRIFQSRIP